VTASITNEVALPQPPELVWQALTDASQIAKWLMPNDFEPRLGHRFTLRTNPMPALKFDGICHCEVTVFEPPHLLAYTWNGGSLRTLVTFRLEQEGGGTRLYFEHSGFDLDDPLQQASYKGMSGGWASLGMEGTKLRRVVEELAAVRE
jgi:uncharacterized protein YndB with AHSA1/START domain